MANKFAIILVTVAILVRVEGVKEDEDVSPFAEAASAILKEQNLQNIGSMVSSFMQNGGAEKLGNMLNSEEGGNIIQGIASMVGGGENQEGLNPALLGAALNMLGSATKGSKNKRSTDGGLDMGDIMSVVGSFMSAQGGAEGRGGNPAGFMEYLPVILNTINAFTGNDAEEREKGHSDHSSLMPPFLEKLHIYFDHFIHSEMGKNLIGLLGAEKIFKIFTDEKGRFDYNKFGDMLENLSFRRHWIRIATDRIIYFLQILADPIVQKQYIATAPFLINSFLQSHQFPKNAMLDLNRPTETISAIVNHVAKKYVGVKVNSKMYVKPAVVYVQDIIKMNNNKKFLDNPRQLSDKIADTINLDIIEPLAKVNRAYRFAKNVPECDKYVLCLVNEENQNEISSLPDLKKILYQGSSLLAGWFLDSHTPTSFWTLYDIITQNKRCKDYYINKCNDFHVEEVRVTTEYVHNEL